MERCEGILMVDRYEGKLKLRLRGLNVSRVQ